MSTFPLSLLGWTIWNCQYSTILTYIKSNFIWFNLMLTTLVGTTMNWYPLPAYIFEYIIGKWFLKCCVRHFGWFLFWVSKNIFNKVCYNEVFLDAFLKSDLQKNTLGIQNEGSLLILTFRVLNELLAVVNRTIFSLELLNIWFLLKNRI